MYSDSRLHQIIPFLNQVSADKRRIKIPPSKATQFPQKQYNSQPVFDHMKYQALHMNSTFSFQSQPFFISLHL